MPSPLGPAAPPVFSTTRFAGRPHWRIATAGATWLLDAGAGGFSSLVDHAGREWIGFLPLHLAGFPEGAAAGFRGLPNLVHGGEDDGVGHPGHDRVETVRSGDCELLSTSLSGAWSWRWRFHPDRAEFILDRAPEDRAWWFLYEGPIAGTFEPDCGLAA